MIQVPSPVKPIFGVPNPIMGTILITFSCMVVNSSEYVDIQYLCLSLREVLCRKGWWHRWSWWKLIYSCSIILKVWLGCFDILFCIWNVSYGRHFHVLSTWLHSVCHVGLGCPGTSPKICGPSPFCAIFFPPPLSSFWNCFQYSSHPMLRYHLPISSYWLQHTAFWSCREG